MDRDVRRTYYSDVIKATIRQMSSKLLIHYGIYGKNVMPSSFNRRSLVLCELLFAQKVSMRNDEFGLVCRVIFLGGFPIGVPSQISL